MSDQERPVAWSVTVRVTDHGRWTPEDQLVAARLIALVNAWRKPTDRKPKVFRDYEGQTCLKVEIGGEEIVLDPGDHLVRMELPQVIAWNAVTPEQLAELFPASWSSAS